jgi:ABC-type multidrug transport system fused ATPase/permease subunit
VTLPPAAFADGVAAVSTPDLRWARCDIKTINLLPNVMAIMEGLKAAKRLYAIIDLAPAIDKHAGGIKAEKLMGKFVFQNVTFAYPKDKSVPILRNLSLEMDAGAINAFVGESGSGKSTIVQLVMRFYDPDEGRITLDGRDLK